PSTPTPHRPTPTNDTLPTTAPTDPSTPTPMSAAGTAHVEQLVADALDPYESAPPNQQQQSPSSQQQPASNHQQPASNHQQPASNHQQQGPLSTVLRELASTRSWSEAAEVFHQHADVLSHVESPTIFAELPHDLMTGPPTLDVERDGRNHYWALTLKDD